jgi:hypothetical protein
MKSAAAVAGAAAVLSARSNNVNFGRTTNRKGREIRWEQDGQTLIYLQAVRS